MSGLPTRRQALVLSAALAGTAGLAALGRHGRGVQAPRAEIDLARLVPEAFEGWQVDPSTRAFVRAGDSRGKAYGIYDQVLERTFMDARGDRIMLSIAYGGEQSARLQLHKPEVCYRASGYEVVGAQAANLQLAGRSVPVTRLVARKPGRHEPITYWTVLGGASAGGSGLAYQWKRASSALRGEVMEGMLVRISSIDPDPVRAHAQQQRFALAFAQVLTPQAQARLLGASI